MDAGDLAPNLAGLAALLVSLAAAVDKGNTLAQVPASLLGAVHALQLDETGVRLLSVLATLVSQVASLDVQTVRRRRVSEDGWMGGRAVVVPDFVLGHH